MTQERDGVLVEVAHDGVVLADQTHEGESWAAAARRLAGDLVAAPVARDLSGASKRFAVEPDVRVTLRDMTRGDLGDITRWRSAPHVLRWWPGDGPPTHADLERAYGDRIDGHSPTRMWVLEVNGRSVGFGQHYRIADYPDHALLGPHPDAIGVDYAIGEPEWAGRGFGTRMIWAWALRARAQFPEAPALFAAPDHRNTASRRVLAKAGFVEGLWFDEPNRQGGVDTVVGCTLDVASVIG